MATPTQWLFLSSNRWSATSSTSFICSICWQRLPCSRHPRRQTTDARTHSQKDVTVVRHTFEELQQLARVDDHGKLFVGDHEVAMLYFRAGYAPSDYKRYAHYVWHALIRLCLQLRRAQ